MDPTLKRLTPTYAILFMRNTAWAITLNGPVMPLYVRSLSVDIVYWGVLATAISAGLFMEVIWGTIRARLVGTSLLYPLYTIKALLPLFIVLQFVFGAVNVMIGLTTRAVIAEDLPTSSSGFYMSLWFFFATLGAIVGPILGTYIASSYGYDYSFYSSIVLVLLAAAFYGFFYLRDKRTAVVRVRNTTSLLTGVKKLLRIGYLPKIYLITRARRPQLSVASSPPPSSEGSPTESIKGSSSPQSSVGHRSSSYSSSLLLKAQS